MEEKGEENEGVKEEEEKKNGEEDGGVGGQ